MGDGAAVALAVAVALGAWWGAGVPRWLALAVVAVAFVAHRPALLWAGGFLLAASLAASAWAGLDPAVPRPYAGTVTLVSDPEPAGSGVRADVRIGSQRLEAWARGAAAGSLSTRLAGERVRVSGAVQRPPPYAPWLSRRHVVGRLAIDEIEGWTPGSPVSQLANGLRRTLAAGTVSMPPDRRALFAGFVLGDDRAEPVEVADDFRAAGLSHLLAVSGQNVAFVLALAAPGLGRLSLRSRLPATLAVIGFFALLTRFEPSVLRASVMAALAATAATMGREASSIRLLALAVAGLVLVDPFLVGNVGFGLSVAASASIVLLAPRITAAIPGPRSLAGALGVTLAAQVGVAPILVPVFGGLPVASVPANLLAVPAAGPIMVWGLTAGLVAGIVGGSVAHWLHAPTDLLIRWVEGVARWAASLPLGELHAVHLAALAVAVGAVAALRRWSRPRAAVVPAVAMALVVAHPAIALMAPPPAVVTLAAGVTLHRSSGPTGEGTAAVLTFDESPDASRLLEALRRAGVRRVDVMVVASGGAATSHALGPVLRRFPPRLLLAPAGNRIPGATVPDVGARVVVGRLAIDIAAIDPRLVATVVETDRPTGSPVPARPSRPSAGVGSAGAPRARAPPVRHHHPVRGHGHPQPHAGLLLRPGRVLRLRGVPGQGRAARVRRRPPPRCGRRESRARARCR